MGAMAEHLKRSWIDRLRFRRLASRSAAEAQTADAGGDPLLLAGERLRQAREQRGLGLRQLAAETLVSTAVIEALERGWRDRLPEPAYLRTILPLLERYLALEPGSLAVALPGAIPRAALAVRTRPGCRCCRCSCSPPGRALPPMGP